MEVRTRLVVGVIALAAAFGLWMLGMERGRHALPVETDHEQEEIDHESDNASLSDVAADRVDSESPTDREEVPVAAAPQKRGRRQKDPPAPRPDEGRVHVRIVARETDAPLVGIRVMLVNERAPAPLGARHTDQSRGRPSEALVTDTEGNVEYWVPAETPYQLWILSRGRQIEQYAIPGIAAGVEHAIEVSMPTIFDQLAHGRVIDGETELPLSGATIRRQDPPDGQIEESPFWSDENGHFEVRTASWRTEGIRVELEGYSTARAEVSGDVEQPTVVSLFRTASLAAEVRGIDGAPVEGLTVRVNKPAQDWSDEDDNWTAVTDAAGSCEFAALAPKVSLEVVVERTSTTGTKPAFLQRAEVQLEPGEQRIWRAVIGTGASVEGLALDENGAPVAELEVWLLPEEDRHSFRSRHDADFEAGRAFECETDGAGRFRFERVPSGRWWVGIGSEEIERSRITTPSVVRVVDDEPPPPITLKVWRGLRIRGQVVRPDGTLHRPEGAMQCLVSASGPSGGASDYAAEDGSFELEPLIPGTYQVKASGGRSFAGSAAVSAAAGDEDVQLVLREGGHVSVRVVDAAGNGVPKADWAMTDQSGKESSGGWTDKRGTFDFRNRAPGVYDFIATTKDGRWGCLRGIVVEAGREQADLEVVLGPGAFLRLHFEGEPLEGLTYRIKQEGAVVATGWNRASEGEIVVPPGRLELEFISLSSSAPVSPDPRSFDVAPGETVELSFELRASD